MKKYLKNREGVALPAVIILMVVMTVLAAGLGTYAKNTLERVVYMNTQKQAYYLARAGVETGAYAYQKATTATSTQGVADFVTLLSSTDSVVKSDNIIYLVPSNLEEIDENAGTPWEGLTFIEKSVGEAPPASAIGYYTIEMVRSYQEVIKDEEETTSESSEETTTTIATALDPCVEIRCTAVCYDDKNATASSETKSYVARGYIFPEEKTNSKIYCDADGSFINDGADKMSANGTYTGVFDACSGPNTLTTQGVNVPHYSTNWDSDKGFFANIGAIVNAYISNFYNGILKTVFDQLLTTFYNKPFYSYGVFSSGYLTVAKPSENIDTFTIKEDNMGFYAFSSPKLLTMDAGLDVETSKGYYSTVALYGNDIVVNGDINMAVYYVKSGTLSGLSNILSAFGNRYRLGTVVIGSGTLSGGTWPEYKSKADGGVTTQSGVGKPTNCNRIFFNGNVAVKIYAQGGSTETYRIFNAGDICLYNGSYVLDTGGTADTGDDVLGIDLLKYFLDSVVEGVNGFEYGDEARTKAKEILELYYSKSQSYYATDNCPIRKLDVNYGTDEVTVDDYSITASPEGKTIAKYIIQPSPTADIEIYWGKPTESGFDKQTN